MSEGDEYIMLDLSLCLLRCITIPESGFMIIQKIFSTLQKVVQKRKLDNFTTLQYLLRKR